MRFGDFVRNTAFACAFGRDAKDITGQGSDNFRAAPLWKGGPTWDDIPAFAKPDDPATEASQPERKKVRTHRAMHVHQVVGWLVGLLVGWLVG